MQGKLIFLYYSQELPIDSIRQVLGAAGSRTLLTVAVSETDVSESIARLELDWTGLPNHSVQFNLEAALNTLASTQAQTQDTGGGPVAVELPGANTRVEEVRGNLQVRDTWSAGLFELDYGLGAEVSTITQSGDADQDRTFPFLSRQRC